MNKTYNISISEKEGKHFSNLSGDKNKIHLDEVYGHNSIFGNKICHGCLVIIKFFEKIKIQNLLSKYNNYNIYINFIKHFKYKIKIKIKKKKNCYLFYQNRQLCAEISIKNIYNLFDSKVKLKKKIKSSLVINKYSKKIKKIIVALCYLSKYVGMIYPGENSLIKSININYKEKNNYQNNIIKIFSGKIDRRLPLINNKMTFENYKINFDSLERPKFIKKSKSLSLSLIKKAKLIKDNIFIIGASSGIGSDILNLFKKNVNIKIIATYYKNKIFIKNKNIIIKKIDIKKDLNKIKNIIKKYSPLTLYYFPTPKILIDEKNKYLLQIYNKYYFNIPLSLIKYSEKYNYKIKLFYPSTVFTNKNSAYVEIKKKAEKKFNKMKLNNVKLNILKIDPVHTKQNLSILNKNTPSFLNILKKNLKYQKKIFK